MQLSPQLKRYIGSVILTSSVVFSGASFAGAFQLWEQNAAGIGDYHAGAAAEADSAATAFYNPAGVTRLQHQQVSMGATLIAVDVKYNGNVQFSGTSTPIVDATGDTVNIVPNFQYALPFADRWAFAFGVTTPFGLSTKYDDVSYVNLLATKTQLETLNLNPSIAYQVNHYLSLGVGFDALYGSADYDSDVFSPLTSDLSGWNYGYNAGALVQFTPATRAGISYRSAITVDAKGPSQSTSLADGSTINSTASAQFPLPATTTLSLYQDVTPRFTLMGSAFYTQWSVFKQLILQNLATPTGTGTVALNENYRDTWNLALGGKFKLNKEISLEAGVGHDQTPTRLGYRDIRLPDNNRYAASLGFNVVPKPGFEWSVGWTHFFIPNTPVDNSLSNDASKTTVASPPNIGVGTVNGNVNVIGTQFSVDL